MIVIRKKRLVLIASMICVSLTMFMLKDSLLYHQTVETVSLPVSNKVIVIDARSSVCQMKELKVEMVQQKHKPI